jgi:hypothetical protein
MVRPSPNPDLATRVRRLEELGAARNVLTEYARVLEEHDPAAVARLFAPDATLETPSASVSGLRDIGAYFAQTFDTDHSTARHFLGNVRADWTGPGRATVSSRFLFAKSRGTGSVFGWGGYDAEVGIEHDTARFTSMTISVELVAPFPAGDGAFGPDRA